MTPRWKDAAEAAEFADLEAELRTVREAVASVSRRISQFLLQRGRQFDAGHALNVALTGPAELARCLNDWRKSLGFIVSPSDEPSHVTLPTDSEAGPHAHHRSD